MGKLMEKSMKSGAMVDTGGLLPFAKGAAIRAAGGKLTVTDGPFIESKEVIGGYAILRANSKAEAIKMGEGVHEASRGYPWPFVRSRTGGSPDVRSSGLRS